MLLYQTENIYCKSKSNISVKLQQEIVSGLRGVSGHNAPRLVEADKEKELALKQYKN